MEVTRGRGRRERARLLRVVQLGARSRHTLGVALVGHFLRSAMRRAGRQAAEQQAVWPGRLAAVSACREGAAAPDRARNRAALWRRLRPHLHHVLDVLCRQLALHLHLGGVNLLLVHCAHTERGMQGEPAPLAAKQEALVPAVRALVAPATIDCRAKGERAWKGRKASGRNLMCSERGQLTFAEESCIFRVSLAGAGPLKLPPPADLRDEADRNFREAQMAASLGILMLALCSSVEAFAPAHMARSAVAVRAAPVRTAPVMQFGKKRLSPEEVSLAGPKRVGLRSWQPALPVSDAATLCFSLVSHATHVFPVAEARGDGLLAGRVAVRRLWLHLRAGHVAAVRGAEEGLEVPAVRRAPPPLRQEGW